MPELSAVVGEEAALPVFQLSPAASRPQKKAALQTAFTALMTRDKSTVAQHLEELIGRLNGDKKVRSLTSKEELILRTEEQYKGDVGVFSIYFLNYLTLSPGEAIYLAANEPHAYLKGECIECMAASDNVVRAGLTPKYRDTENLCSMLTYNQGLPEVLRGTPVDKCMSVYTPPFDEFEVERIVVPMGQTYFPPVIGGPSILLSFKGHGAITQSYGGKEAFSGLKVGDVLFIPAFAKLELSAVVDAAAGDVSSPFLELYRARVNNRVLTA